MNERDIRTNIRFQATGAEQVEAATRKVSGALDQTGSRGQASAKQIANAYRQLPAQFQDIAVSLAGGQNPAMVLLQQGSQIVTSFGSVKDTVKALTALLSPLRIAIGGAAAAVGIFGGAFIAASRDADNLNRSLTLTGNLAAINTSRFKAMAEAISGSTGNSIGNTRDLLGGAVASGVLGKGSIEAVTEAMARFQSVTGATTEEVLGRFRSIAEGAARWSAEQNKSMGYLTAEQFRYIAALEQTGQKEKAQAEAARLFSEGLASRQRELSAFGNVVKEVSNAASGLWNSIKNIFYADDELAQAESRLANLERLQRSNTRQDLRAKKRPENGNLDRQVQEARDRVAELKRLRDEESAQSAANRAEVKREASGLNARLSNAGTEAQLVQSRIENIRALSELNDVETRLNYARNNRLITEEEFARRQKELNLKQIDLEIQSARQRASAARAQDLGPFADAGARADQANRVRDLDAEVIALQEKRRVAEVTAEQNIATAINITTKAREDYRAQLQFTNEMLALEGEQVGMTAFAYEALVREKNREFSIREKVKNMAPSEAEAYREIAKAAAEEEESIRRANFEKSRTFESGLQEALKKYADEATNAAMVAKEATEAMFQGMSDALVQFVTTGKLNFRDFARSVIADLAQIAARKAATGIFTTIAGAVAGAFSPGAGTTAGTTTGGQFNGIRVPAFANGGIMGADGPMPLRRYATGGIARSPQLAMFGEGSMPEAYVPLPNGRSIPVTLAGAEGGSSDVFNVSVVVNNDGSQSGSGDGGKPGQLGNIIASVVRDELIKQRRPGGLLAA